MKNYISIILYMFCITVYFAAAQQQPVAQEIPVFTEEEAIQTALRNNMQLKISSLDLGTAQYASKTRWNEFFPDLSAAGTFSRNGFDPSGSWSLSVSAGASLQLSSSKIFSVSATQRAYERQQLSFSDTQRNLERNVKKNFYSLVVAQAALQNAEQNAENARKKYETDLRDYNRGLVSEMVHLRSKLAYETAKNTLEDVRLSNENDTASFCALLGLSYGSSFQIQGTLPSLPSDLDAKTLVSRYLGNRIDIRDQMTQIETLERERIQSYVNMYTPVLSASYSVSYGNILSGLNGGSSPVLPSWEDTGSFRISLSIPLDSFIPGTKQFNSAYYAKSRQIERARLTLNQLISDAENAVTLAVMKINRNAASIDNLKLNCGIAMRALELTEAAYRNGEVPYSDVSDAQSDYDSALYRVLTAQSNCLSQIFDLEYMLNITIIEK